MRRIALILTMVAGAAALTPQDASPGQQPEIRGFVVEPAALSAESPPPAFPAGDRAHPPS